MAERAPLSVTFYLSAEDAGMFRALWAVRMGGRHIADEHDKLIDAGLLELEEFNPLPDGTRADEVSLTTAGKRELARLHKAASESFESKRRGRRGAMALDRSAGDHLTRRPGPGSTGETSAGRASRLVQTAKPHEVKAGGKPKSEGA